MVAVVVVCFNQARFLHDALHSVMEQSLPADEIILVDDGSTDETASVAAEYAHVRYLWQTNAGLSAARATGLAATKSRYVLFLDADDKLSPDALAAALRCMASDRDLAFVYGGYREVTEGGACLSVHTPRVYPDALGDLLRRGNYIAMHGTVLYLAELLRASGGSDVGLRCCEDYDVYLRLARDRRIAVYPEIVADYRRHGESLSRNTLRMVRTACKVLDRHAVTPAERTLARQGKAVMEGYYCRRWWTTAYDNLRRLDMRRFLSQAGAVTGAPALWRPLVRALAAGLLHNSPDGRRR